MEMANIFDVAKYILKKEGPVSAMKLEKLCYYSQAWSLVWDEEPIFDEDFEAWANGPVCRRLYNIHRGMFRVSSDDISDKMCDGNLTDNQIDTIDRVLSYYGDKAAYWLSELTHQERPWKQTRHEAGVAAGEPCDRIIDKDLILDYYSGL